MYVRVRTIDGSKTVILTISKLTKIEEVRTLIHEKMEVEERCQSLFFRGKRMEDGHTLFDYGVNINDVLQLMVKPVLQEVTNICSPKTSTKTKIENIDQEKNKEEIEEIPTTSNSAEIEKTNYFKVGDLVEAKYFYDGSWWEAKIIKITDKSNAHKRSRLDDGYVYTVKYQRPDDQTEEELNLQSIRPRSTKLIPLQQIKNGSTVMVNYNIEEPMQLGYWYDCKVQRIIDTSKEKKLIGTLILSNQCIIENCEICNVEEIMEIESISSIPKANDNPIESEVIATTSGIAKCTFCKDNPKKKCKECGCMECGGKENPGQQLMCDECDQAFHIYCLDPPLEEIPDQDDWYCPLCKNDDSEIVRAGEKLKTSKKKAKMASSINKTNRDWGKGFACAGRQKICSIVPQNHFGSIPGVEVGTAWKFRLQASEAGIHRPHVAGIHGRENEGAYSIVLSGGYEDDEDRGDEFTYTGSGGRDLSGNKRTAEQSCDQQLTRMNKALALNCNVRVNKEGAEAKDWKGGKPVRVVRNAKGRKHSDYAPEDGNRYDGIYKVVKYWQSSGKSGFKVWRYLLRRDDDIPAPWTEEGAKRIEELGLTLQYPEGYLEAQKEKEKLDFIVDDDEQEGKKKGRKRKSHASQENSENSPKPKKAKCSAYSLEKDLLDLIKKDSGNEKTWDECRAFASEGKAAFLKVVEERFLCVCCQSLATKPVSTSCQHNFCVSCLQRSFKAQVYNCPSCRTDLGVDYVIKPNAVLEKLLNKLFPGYEA